MTDSADQLDKVWGDERVVVGRDGRRPVCGELLQKLRPASDIGLGSNHAGGRNADLTLLNECKQSCE